MPFISLKNNLLIFSFAVLLTALALLFTFFNHTKNAESIAGLLKNSGSYHYIAEIIKAEVERRYPKNISTNLLRTAIANNILNFVVTPETVQRIAEPALKGSKTIARQPTDIINNRVVVKTDTYKQQVMQDLRGLDLPPVITETAQSVIQSVPQNLELVNTDERPNSILAKIIRFRTFITNIGITLSIMWVLVIGVGIWLTVNNRHRFPILMTALAWGFGIGGVLLLLVSFITPFTLSRIISQPITAEISGLYNGLVTNLVEFLFAAARQISLLYLFISVILFTAWYFLYRRSGADRIDAETQTLPKRSTRKKSPR